MPGKIRSPGQSDCYYTLLQVCLVQVDNGIELEAVGFKFEPYRWRPSGVTWDSSRTVVVIKLRRTSDLHHCSFIMTLFWVHYNNIITYYYNCYYIIVTYYDRNNVPIITYYYNVITSLLRIVTIVITSLLLVITVVITWLLLIITVIMRYYCPSLP